MQALRLIAACFLFLAAVGVPAKAQSPEPVVRPGTMVVTGFSGTRDARNGSVAPQAMADPDRTFIDLNGSSARFYLPVRPGFVQDGRLWNLDDFLSVPAAQIGQVFGIALDDGWPRTDPVHRSVPNVYLSATSVYGLNIVIPDSNGDGLPERVVVGQPGAYFMEGQFGTLTTPMGAVSGPGSIYKVDGVTGEVSLFANLAYRGVPNSGPGLGNITYDRQHRQLFVSDRDTGMIHRLDLDGNDLGIFDHGIQGRAAAGLPVVPFNPANRMNVNDPSFDAEDPGSWAFPVAARRIWGLAVHRSRLYYAVAEGPSIWSVGIDPVSGDFLDDARWELDLPPEASGAEVSDILFNRKGAMILAQRGAQLASYDYDRFSQPRRARVLRFWREQPDDPKTPGIWQPVPEEYAIGFRPDHRNAAGGVALYYGYTAKGQVGGCYGTLWATGDDLRVNRKLAADLALGGEAAVHGVQASPQNLVRNLNTPPWKSYFIDYDKIYGDPRMSGHVGDVETYHPCRAGGVPPVGWLPPFFFPPIFFPPSGGGSCIQVATKATCNPKTGQWDVNIWVNEGNSGLGADMLKVLSGTPGVTVQGGPMHSLNPANISLSGSAPSGVVDLSLCAFDSVQAATGQPFTCCRASTRVRLPEGGCGDGAASSTQNGHSPVLRESR